MWTRTADPQAAPDKPVDIALVFMQGLPVKLSVEGKEYTDGLELFVKLNEIGKEAGIGRIDIVEVCKFFAAPLGTIKPFPFPEYRQEPHLTKI